MARLPQPGGDDGDWGEILNDYLSQIHKNDGTLKNNSVTNSALADNAVSAATIADGSITEVLFDAAVRTKLNTTGTVQDADATTKGKLRLTGDLGGTAEAPTVPGLAGKEASIIAGTSSQYYRGDKSWQTLNKAAVGLTNVDDTSDANKPISTATQTALNTKATASTLSTVATSGSYADLSNRPTIPTDATTGAKGIVQLAGDLAGTSALPVVANGVITSAKIADATITTTDISATAAIAKTQLAADVQASLAKADTALQTAAPSSGSATQSGFPLRKPGEMAIVAPQEVAVARANASDPAGHKIVVLAESWDKPGVLKHIWVACDNSATSAGFLEQGGTIRIYTDNSTVPAVSMSLGDFFCLANRSDVFSTPRVGRADRGSGGSAYRYLHMPFQKYLRVEVESTIATDTLFYGTADYSTLNSFSDLGSQQLAYGIKGQRVTNQAAQTPMTICDFNGAGQIESLVVSFSGEDAGDLGVLEGNVDIYVDNELYPSWSSSGMEDAFNGGWYAMPVGGYPAGRAGNSDQPGANQTMYRFFVDDPIFYNSHLRVVVNVGQPYQGSIVSPTINFAGYVGVWSNTPVTPNYTAVDAGATPVVDDQMNQAAGTLNAADWNQEGSRTQLVATGSTFAVPYGSGGAHQDTRAARKNVSLPTDYWTETRFRVTDATHDDQEVSLIMLGATPDPYFGSAVHIQLRRDHQRSWKLTLRDDFSTPFVTFVGGGRDLTNIWVRVALKKQGNRVTGYYSFNDAPAAWIPIGTWEATKSGSGFGVGTWDAGAEFDYLVVRPLRTVTS
ncbi:DUF2961 domain-containing protein [Candidatus Saccharibacteria bacterium]|nr:DUF2961 domain-containing protein [Candidatus Saccharibacteria bacterium]